MRVKLQGDSEVTECYGKAAECYSEATKCYKCRDYFRRLHRGNTQAIISKL
jgi:hypothetical protein